MTEAVVVPFPCRSCGARDLEHDVYSCELEARVRAARTRRPPPPSSP